MKSTQRRTQTTSKQARKPKTKRGPNLRTAEDVRRYLAHLLKRATVGEGGRDAVSSAYKLAMVSSFLLKAIEASDIERRLAQLELEAEQRQTKSKYGEGKT